MAWETVNYSCGHSERMQFYGKHVERDRKREWMERGVCPDCYRAEKELERKQENERAASLTNELGFVALTGSGKQVAWATSIRQQCFEKVVAGHQPHPEHGWNKMIAVINLENSAKWWIDNRSAIGTTALKLIGANHPAAFQALKEA